MLDLAGLSGCQSNLEPEPPVCIPRAFAGESPRESRVPLRDLSFSFSRLDSLNFGLKSSHVLLLWAEVNFVSSRKPVSEKQLEANRGHAAHSTGLRARAGKGGPSYKNSQTDPFGKPNPNQKHHLRPSTTDPISPHYTGPQPTSAPQCRDKPLKRNGNVLHDMLKMHLKLLDKFKLIFYDRYWMRSSNRPSPNQIL